jgi:F-type H+-transporting ATPase subunit epsilon
MPLVLTITTPEGLVYQDRALSVVVPAKDGELGILPRHAALIAVLGVGELRVKPVSGGGVERFFIAGGFVQVRKDRVVVLATRAEPAKAIDRARAEEEVRSLLSTRPPAGSSLEALAERAEKIRAAQARVKTASRIRAAG